MLLLVAGPAGRTDAAAHSVAMSDHVFWSFATMSSSVTVRVGDTVTWQNRGNAYHNARASGWSSPNLAPGESYSRTFTAPGEFRYACTLHEVEEMFGTVVVLGAAPASPRRVLLPVAQH